MIHTENQLISTSRIFRQPAIWNCTVGLQTLNCRRCFVVVGNKGNIPLMAKGFNTIDTCYINCNKITR